MQSGKGTFVRAGRLLYDFPNFVFDDRFNEVPAVLLAAGHRLHEMPDLLGRDFARQGRFIWIHDGFHYGWSWVRKRFP